VSWVQGTTAQSNGNWEGKRGNLGQSLAGGKK